MNRKLIADTGKFLRQIRARRDKAALTPTETGILYALAGFKKPVGRAELSEVIGCSIGGIDSGSTCSLHKAGFITKTPVLVKGRKFYAHKNDLEITQKGLKLLHLISTGKESK